MRASAATEPIFPLASSWARFPEIATRPFCATARRAGAPLHAKPIPRVGVLLKPLGSGL